MVRSNSNSPQQSSDNRSSTGSGTLDRVRDVFSGDFNITKERAAIDPRKIHQGCLGGKDCIPSIDNPKFESVSEANQWLSDDDLIFGIEINGDVRAYSQRILNWHELVNDTVGGQPVLISFCPLCGTAIAFDRTIDGKAIEFGVSGKLVNSNLVMYNRADNSLWQQQGGEQIVGDNLGAQLTKVPLTTTTWVEWKKAHPNSKNLSRDTGTDRNYAAYPYGSYEQDRSINFPVDNRDDRLHEKAVVYGIEVNGEFAAYSEDFLAQTPALEDTVGGREIKIVRRSGGEVTFTDSATNEEIVPERGFWFSWVAFHPETKLNGE